MADIDREFPAKETLSPVPEEFTAPSPRAEFSEPDAADEQRPPACTDYENPDEAQEFTPPGSGGKTDSDGGRKRRLRTIAYLGAAVLLLLMMRFRGNQETPVPTVPAPSDTTVWTSGSDIPEDVWTSGSDISLPVLPGGDVSEDDGLPELKTVFFQFSHEHHARIILKHGELFSDVSVTVDEPILGLRIYEHSLTEDEILAGYFALPVLSADAGLEEHWDEYDAMNRWPISLEMTVTARCTDRSGEEQLLFETVLPEYELGIGVSYWGPDYTWSEQIPPDSFVVAPWEDLEEIVYVINDPSRVTDPLTFSVDISYNGRHAAPEDYEDVVVRSEFEWVDAETGERTPDVSVVRELVLRRPDWMPESGTVHIVIVQKLASTGELWIREYDKVYPTVYDW